MERPERYFNSVEESPEIKNECGLFAVYLNNPLIRDVRLIASQGGVALQHRAEGATGLYVSNGRDEDILKQLGTVSVATDEGRRLPSVENANLAIIHTRYATSGKAKNTANIQPLQKDGITFAHHGNLTNAIDIRASLDNLQHNPDGPDSDSWIALNAISKASGETLGEKVMNAQSNFEGGWAFIVSDGKSLVASRDPYGIRPLFLGMMGSEENSLGYLLSVESAPFRYFNVGDQFREIHPGETIQIDENGVQQLENRPKGSASCIFEYVYMMRPDSIFNNKSIYKTRVRAGRQLWQETPVTLMDGKKLVVMPIPNSGRPAALGFYHEAKKVLGENVIYDERILANQYMGRNFIKATDNRAAYLKFYPIQKSFLGEEIEDGVDEFYPYMMNDDFTIQDGEGLNYENLRNHLEDYVFVTVDDSTVRGDTQPDITYILRQAGILEYLHRVASPAIKVPCVYGVAMPTFGELIANKIPNIEDRAKYLGPKSMAHLSLNGLIKAIGVDKDRLCTNCMDGVRPYYHDSGTIPLNEQS